MWVVLAMSTLSSNGLFTFIFFFLPHLLAASSPAVSYYCCHWWPKNLVKEFVGVTLCLLIFKRPIIENI